MKNTTGLTLAALAGVAGIAGGLLIKDPGFAARVNALVDESLSQPIGDTYTNHELSIIRKDAGRARGILTGLTETIEFLKKLPRKRGSDFTYSISETTSEAIQPYVSKMLQASLDGLDESEQRKLLEEMMETQLTTALLIQSVGITEYEGDIINEILRFGEKLFSQDQLQQYYTKLEGSSVKEKYKIASYVKDEKFLETLVVKSNHSSNSDESLTYFSWMLKNVHDINLLMKIAINEEYPLKVRCDLYGRISEIGGQEEFLKTEFLKTESDTLRNCIIGGISDSKFLIDVVMRYGDEFKERSNDGPLSRGNVASLAAMEIEDEEIIKWAVVRDGLNDTIGHNLIQKLTDKEFLADFIKVFAGKEGYESRLSSANHRLGRLNSKS